MLRLSTFLSLLPLAYLAQAQIPFVAPSTGPLVPSPNYGGPSNGSLAKQHVVHGKAFDRIVIILLENTDFADAVADPTFASLIQQGILHSNSLAVTHPSEPNYVALGGGDFFGMRDDGLHSIPSNVSTIVDLLEQKGVSWAAYQESMATDGDSAFAEVLPNYLNNSFGLRQFYVRKHNPLVIYDSVATVPERARLIRNFNDFAADVNASVLPQWTFITPNLVNDGHDTGVGFAASWLEFFLIPLLDDKHFNNKDTLVVLTFDENDNHNENNQVFTLLLGGAVPKHLRGTIDDTFFTHYSTLSTVEANWELGCLGRNDANKIMSNVFSFVADRVGYKNINVMNPPLTNLSGVAQGPFNPSNFAPFPAPDVHAKCAGGGQVFGVRGDDHGGHHDDF